MNKVVIKRITLDNYKGVKHFDGEFFEDTLIEGKNGLGKTTLLDAYLDVFTGKLSDGSSADGSIRPHDENGISIDRVPIVRTIVAEVNGTVHTIVKTTTQKWVKARGSVEEEFKGNETTYKIDGFDLRAKDFTAWIEQNIGDPETLAMCSSAAPFLSVIRKSTTDARQLLEKLSGFSLEVYVAQRPEYSDIGTLLNGMPLETVVKTFKKNLTAQKKSLAEAQSNLAYEQGRPVEEVNEEAYNAQVADYNAEIKKITNDVAGIECEVRDYLSLLDKRVELNSELVAAQSSRGAERQTALFKAQAAYNEARSACDFAIREHDHAEAVLANTKAEIEEATRCYELVRQKKFDEDSVICPTCGQEYPAEKVTAARQAFETHKEQDLQKWSERMAQAASYIDAALESEEKAAERLAAAQKELEESKKALEAARAIPDSQPTDSEADIMDSLEKLNALIDSTNDPRIRLNVTRQLLSDKIRTREAIIARCNQAVSEVQRKTTYLENLKAIVVENAQACAELERNIDLLLNFSIEKNKALAETINVYFRDFFTFKTLEYTQDGNPVETLKMFRNGTSYSDGLNTSDRKLVEMALTNGLQELNGLALPIWIDEASEIDPWRIPKNKKRQMIVIQRSDYDLTVTERR